MSQVLSVSLVGSNDETYIEVRRKLLHANQFLVNLVHIKDINGCFHEPIVIENISVKLCFKNHFNVMIEEVLNLMQSECVLITFNHKCGEYDRLKTYFLASKLAKITKIAVIVDLDDFCDQPFLNIKQNAISLMNEVEFKPYVCEFVPISTAQNINIEYEHDRDWFMGPKLFDIFRLFEESKPKTTMASHNRAILTLLGEFKYVCQTMDDVSLRDQKMLIHLDPTDYFTFDDFDNCPLSGTTTIDYMAIQILHDFQDRKVTWAYSINATIHIMFPDEQPSQIQSGIQFKFERFDNNKNWARLEIIDEQEINGFKKVRIHFNEPVWFETLTDCRALGSFIASCKNCLIFGICESIETPYQNKLMSDVADTLFAIRNNNLDLLKCALDSPNHDQFTAGDFSKFLKFAIACSEPEIIAYLLKKHITLYSCMPSQIVYMKSSVGKIFKELRQVFQNLNVSPTSLTDMVSDNLILIANMRDFIGIFDNFLPKLTDSEQRNQLAVDINNMRFNLEKYSETVGFDKNDTIFLLKNNYSEVIFEQILDPTLNNTLIKFDFNSMGANDRSVDSNWFLRKIYEEDDCDSLRNILKIYTFGFEEYAKLLSEAKRKTCSRIAKCIETHYFSLLDFETNKDLLFKIIQKFNGRFFIDVHILLKLNRTNEANVRNVLNAIAVRFLCQQSKIEFYEEMPSIILFLKVYFKHLLPDFSHYLETIHCRFHQSPSNFKLFYQEKFSILGSQIVCETTKKRLTLLDLLLAENLLELSKFYDCDKVRVFSDIEILGLFENHNSAKPVLFYYKAFQQYLEFRKYWCRRFSYRICLICWEYITKEDLLFRFFQEPENYSCILPF